MELLRELVELRRRLMRLREKIEAEITEKGGNGLSGMSFIDEYSTAVSEEDESNSLYKLEELLSKLDASLESLDILLQRHISDFTKMEKEIEDQLGNISNE